ncbi:hypothetical protein Hanom_Chr09g00771681 [Helianthus anomalus]
MRWRLKDQSMSFDLDEDFVFDKTLALALAAHQSPIRPLPEHFLLLGRLCFSWSHGDRKWAVIRRKSDRVIMSLRDALKVPSFDVAFSAQEIRPLAVQDAAEPSVADGASFVPTPTKETAGSSGSQSGKRFVLDDVDDDPEIRKLDEALQYRPSPVSLTSKGATLDLTPNPLVRKRKKETVQIRSSDPLPLPRSKKNKKGSSFSEGDVMNELDEHLTGGKFSREEATLARTKPTPTFSSGFLPSNEVESMETEILETTSKEKEKTRNEPKVVTFSGMALSSSLGPDRFTDGEEDQVSSLPSSWFGHELMSFFRYAYVFSDDMEIDPATAEDKFIPDWDIRNKDSVMDELVARTFLFNINTPLDHARSRKKQGSKCYGFSVRENLEKEISLLKRKIQRTPDSEKKIAQLTQDLQVQQENVKSLMTQIQSSQAAAASAAEYRDRIAAELKNFSESLQEKDREHKEVMAKMEESFNNARLAYANMMAGTYLICKNSSCIIFFLTLSLERDMLKTGEADLKAQIGEMKCNHEAAVGEIKKENAALKASVDDLQMTKTWLLTEGALLLPRIFTRVGR